MRTSDCVVIGGGIAGLSLAAALAPQMKVTVLEAESAPGYHASGRSVAYAHFGLGERVVRSLTAASLEDLRQGRSPSGTPLSTIQPAIHIARADQAETLDALADVHAQFGCTFDRFSGEDARAIVPVLKLGPEHVDRALIDHGALKLDTDAMLQSHLATLRAHNGVMVTGARVTAIKRSGVSWTITSGGDEFQTPLLVNAAGAWVDEIAKMAGVRPIQIEPRRRTVISIKPPGNQDVADWPFVKTVGDGFYMLPEGHGRLLVSSMDQTPSAPCDAAAEELDMAVAADVLERATTLVVNRIEHSWAGLRSFAPDELPVIGEANEAPGFFWFAGQGGYGFQTSPALARIASAAIAKAPFPEGLAHFDLDYSAFAPERFRS